MAEGLNRVILLGNLGMDPELKYTQAGQALLRLRLATTESWKSADGERQERTEWHTVLIWGKRAEALADVLEKGRAILVEGRIQHRQWDDKDGNKRTYTDIVATDLKLIGSGNRDGGSAPDRTRTSPRTRAPEVPRDDWSDDDIPF